MKNSSTLDTKPFLKWVGGKGKLVPQLTDLFPAEFNNYFEPFVGGGAVFFNLSTNNTAYINDLNRDLMAVYRFIQQDVQRIIAALAVIEQAYKALDQAAQQDYFYQKRSEYNNCTDAFQRSVLLLFLNKTCFNGLYRQNAKGQFNVPFGKYANPTICNPINLQAVSNRLQNTVIQNETYGAAVRQAQAGDFIYFDPPYYPLSETSSFTAYHADGFTAKDQAELKDTFAELDKRGCYVMLSNSSSDFIKQLYKDYRQETIYAARAINSKATGRGKIAEVVIMNY